MIAACSPWIGRFLLLVTIALWALVVLIIIGMFMRRDTRRP